MGAFTSVRVDEAAGHKGQKGQKVLIAVSTCRYGARSRQGQKGDTRGTQAREYLHNPQMPITSATPNLTGGLDRRVSADIGGT